MYKKGGITILTLKKIQNLIQNDRARIEEIEQAKRYYKNITDIQHKGCKGKNLMRNADNRISNNFHQSLVEEKAGYMFTYPVLFNLDKNDKLEKSIFEVLGDYYEKTMMKLCIETSNCGVAWLHYWFDEMGEFKYAPLKTEQIIAVESDSLLDDEYDYIIRYYKNKNKEYVIQCFSQFELHIYTLKDNFMSENVIETTLLNHTFGRVPFISFSNNLDKTTDLAKYKALIDVYDRISSGFVNDVDDIQEIFFILKGYDVNADNIDNISDDESIMETFLKNLKKFKTVPLDEDGGALDTVTIDIPVEARKILLKQVKDLIIEFGQGLQQPSENGFGDSSGTALKFFYRKLEHKSGLLETEFKQGINQLIRVIAKEVFGQNVGKITQTWTRNMISNDLEIAQIVQASVGIIPTELLYRYHPFVDDVNEAIELQKKSEEVVVDTYEQVLDR